MEFLLAYSPNLNKLNIYFYILFTLARWVSEFINDVSLKISNFIGIID